MDDLISRKAAIDAFLTLGFVWDDSLSGVEKEELDYAIHGIIMAYKECIEQLPSVQPKPIKIQIDHELTHDELERLRKDMADAPIMLLPSAQLEQKQKDPDVIEVIRCKDCKHRLVNARYREGDYSHLKAMCDLDTGDPFELGRNAWKDEWYCADAEKQEEGDE